jgi:hypothetical protein
MYLVQHILLVIMQMVAPQHRVQLVQLRHIHILIGMMTMELTIILVQKFIMLLKVILLGQFGPLLERL